MNFSIRLNMDMNADIEFNETKYSSSGIDRKTSVAPHTSNTVIKYITPRVITPSVSTSFQGSLGGIGSSNVTSNYPPTATTHGLATLVHPARFSTIPSIHSIDGERIIDELRELSRVTATLGDTIIQYCSLEARNRAQELQIEWLENHRHENGSVIERMFQTEIESAQKLITDSLEQKANLESKFNANSRATNALDEQYRQLLSTRTQSSRELFDLERQIAQNNAEAQFLRRRIHQFDDEMKFYILKNRILQERKVRVQYELDQELFSHQSLRMEVELLETDKITHEDIHAASLDDVQKSIDISQVSSIQPPKSYSQQLSDEVQRIREAYERQIEVYREELHRKYELELHRYQITKSNSSSIVTREHHLKFERYQHENHDVQQQIAAVRGSTDQIMLQIETIEKQILTEKSGQPSMSHTRSELNDLNQWIKDRERQLEDVLRIRNSLKEEINNYRKRLERYPKQRTNDYYNKRSSVHEMDYSSTGKSTARLSLQEPLNEQTRSSSIPMEELWEEGTLTRYTDFNLDQDCEELHRLFTNSNIDESGIIRILCNRNTGQRLQIRDKYKNLFNRNLSDTLETLLNQNLTQLLRILLLSPIERDCFELRRILKASTVDINILVEIFFTRSNKHIQSIRDAYQTLFDNTLEHDIVGEENNPSKRVFLALLQSNRPEVAAVDVEETLRDARDLYETESKWKTDDSMFIRLLCTRSNAQLKEIFTAYQQFSRIDIEQAIQVHSDDDIYNTFRAIVQVLRSRTRYFAYQLKNSIKSTATNVENLNRIIVFRCEIDMVQIKNEYEKLVKRTLYDHIQADTNGNYKRALLELIRQRIEPKSRSESLRRLNERTELSRTQSCRRSETCITRASSNSLPKRSFARSSSDRAINQRKPEDDNSDPPFNGSFYSSFDSNNQAKSSSLSTIIPKRTQRTFVPMPTTVETHSQSSNDGE